jgi:MoaA/NifB/PqqE/SkfB family radical SAM enzyme
MSFLEVPEHKFPLVHTRKLALVDVKPQFEFARVKVTENCDSRCVTCSYWRQKSVGELSTEELKDVLRQLRRVDVRRVAFTGGEPTLNRELEELIREARELAFQEISMTTSALFPARRAISLVKSGLTRVVLSLDGIDTHDEIRGIKNNLRKTLEILDILLELRQESFPHLDIDLAMTLMEATLNQVRKVIALAEEKKVSMFVNLIDNANYFFQGVADKFMKVTSFDALNEAVDYMIAKKKEKPWLIKNSVQSLQFARVYFEDQRQGHIPCYLGFISIEVDARGQVYTGCWWFKPVGSLREQSLEEILASEAFRRQIEAMFRKECPGCSCNYIENINVHTAVNLVSVPSS